MKKLYQLMAVALLAMTMAACSDDDNVKENNKTKTDPEMLELDPYEKHSEAGSAMYRMVALLTDADSLPDNWKTTTFEVDYGKVTDASQPTVRSVVVENIDQAAQTYSMLTGKSITGDTKEDTWKMDDVGELKWTAVNDPSLFATIDFDVKQLPGLTQIRFVPESAIGDNAGYNGIPYYYYGDVVRDTNGEYWICVQPANTSDNQSYWVNFIDPDTSYAIRSHCKVYHQSGDKKYQMLPDKLGLHDYLPNSIVLLKSITHYALDPNNTTGWTAHNNDQTAFFQDLYQRYTDMRLWDLIFPGGWNTAVYLFATQGANWSIQVFHSDHSYWFSNVTLNYMEATGEMVYKNDFQNHSWKYDATQLSFDPFSLGRPEGGKPNYLYAQCKTGKELSSNKLFVPDAGQPLPGVTDVMVRSVTPQRQSSYTGYSYYSLGDVFQDENDGSMWFSVFASGGEMTKSPYSYLVSFDPGGFYVSTPEGIRCSNTVDVPNFDLAVKAFHNMWMMVHNGTGNASSQGAQLLSHIKTYTGVDLFKMFTICDSLLPGNRYPRRAIETAAIAYTPTKNQWDLYQEIRPYEGFYQPIIRFIQDSGDPASDRQWILNYNTVYPGTDRKYRLQDVMDPECHALARGDHWMQLPLAGTTQRRTGEPFTVDPSTYGDNQVRSCLWNPSTMNFARPDFTTIYHDHCFFYRVAKVYDCGEYAHDVIPVNLPHVKLKMYKRIDNRYYSNVDVYNSIFEGSFFTDDNSNLTFKDGQVYHFPDIYHEEEYKW